MAELTFKYLLDNEDMNELLQRAHGFLEHEFIELNIFYSFM